MRKGANGRAGLGLGSDHVFFLGVLGALGVYLLAAV